MVHKDHRDNRVLREPQGNKVRQVTQDRMALVEPQDSRASRVPQDHSDQQDLQETLVSRVRLGPLVTLAVQGLSVILVHRDHWGQLGPTAPQDLTGFRELMELQVLKVFLETLVHKDLRVRQDPLVCLVLQDFLEMLEWLDHLVPLVLKGLLGLLVPQDLRVFRVCLDLMATGGM